MLGDTFSMLLSVRLRKIPLLHRLCKDGGSIDSGFSITVWEIGSKSRDIFI